MALGKIYITVVPGQTWVQNPALAFVEIMLVRLEGIAYVPTTGTPMGNQFLYSSGSGRIDFDAAAPFEEMALETIDVRPVVYIEYKY